MPSDNEYVQPDLESRPDLPGSPNPPARSDRRRPDEEDEDYPRPSRRSRRWRRGRQQVLDDDHLRVLSILHYVYGGLALVGGLFPLIYVFIGVLMVSGAMAGPRPGSGPPAVVGWFFIVIPGFVSVLAWAMGLCVLYAGYALSQRRRYLFCFVMAALCCINVPLGTALGVFTIIVLARPSVKEAFESNSFRSPRDEYPDE
jgi:hypothetical protein